MAAATPAIGLAHVTVVPTNFAPAPPDGDRRSEDDERAPSTGGAPS